MPKIYQPIVIERVNEIIEILTETHFFSDYDLDNTEFAKTYLLDKLTEKFIAHTKAGQNADALTAVLKPLARWFTKK